VLTSQLTDAWLEFVLRRGLPLLAAQPIGAEIPSTKHVPETLAS